MQSMGSGALVSSWDQVRGCNRRVPLWRVQAQSAGLVSTGDRIVVTQCARYTREGEFEEAGLIKVITVEEEEIALLRNMHTVGSSLNLADADVA